MAKGTLQISLLWILIWRNYLDGPRGNHKHPEVGEGNRNNSDYCVGHIIFYSHVLISLHLKTNHVI